MFKEVGREASEAGIERGLLGFDNPALAEFRWPYVEIIGSEPGPRLCVMGGVHPNELSSLAAAVALGQSIAPEDLTGTVSIIPIVNLPGLYDHVKELCPVDGDNIHWKYPGDPDGSFSTALAHALLFDWSGDADALIDLHGGDLHEKFSRYTVWQRSGEAELDERNERLARCFDADFIVGLDSAHMERPGRCCTAAAALNRLSLVVEGGSDARFDESHMLFHLNGVMNVARELGLLGGRPVPARRRQLAIGNYHFVTAPADSLVIPRCEPGDLVEKDQVLMECRDSFGRRVGEVVAPVAGYLIWRTSHLAAREGVWIGAIGTLA